MKPEVLIVNCKQLFHVAEDGSWPSIKTHGLLSTSSLLKKWGYSEKEKEAMCRKHRPNSIIIENENFGRAVLCDQKAINHEKLKCCLVDTTEEEWYRLLNNKVFFWPDWQALKWFLGATAYFNRPHVVITIDARQFLAKYEDQITLSSINSGGTFPKKNQDNPEHRGMGTFKSISEYQSRWFRELAVDNGVQNIVSFALSADRLVLRSKDAEPEKLESLWRPGNE